MIFGGFSSPSLIDMTTWTQRTPTHSLILQSSVSGDYSMAQSLLALDPTVLNARNSHGLSILQVSLIHRHFQLAKLFLEGGIDVHARDNCGWTALHDAALFKSTELVEMLVELGSSVTAKNGRGELPIDVAADMDMENLLCNKMIEAGHYSLAEEYRVKYGLLGMGNVNESIRSGLCTEQEGSYQASSHNYNKNGPSFLAGSNASCPQDMNNVNTLREGNLENHTHKQISSQYKRDGESEIRDNSSEQFVNNTRSTGTQLNTVPECEEDSTPAEQEEFTTRQTSSPVPRFRKANLFEGRTPMSSIVRSQSFDAASLYSNSTQELANSMHLTGSAEQVDVRGDGGESPIELLKMRPRKPSLVDVSRRRSGDVSDRRKSNPFRRSVTFQPEVLLQEVVTEGDAEMVKEILTSGAVDVNKMSPVGLTALHQCALDGNITVAKTLVFNGADVNSIDADGWTPLHGAAANGHLDVVKFLILSGANVKSKTEDNQTPFNLAKKGSIRKVLYRAMSGKTVDPKEDEDISDGDFSTDEEEQYSHAESDSEDDVCLLESDPNLTLNWSRITSTDSPTDNVFSDNHTVLTGSDLLKDRDLSDSTSSYGSFIEDQDNEDRHDHLETCSIMTTSTLCNDSMDDYLTDTDKETILSEDQGISTMDASSDSSHRRMLCSDDEGTFRDVLDTELDPNTIDYKFQEAVLCCDIDALMKLHKQRSEINVNRVNKTSGISALHHAVLEENYAMVQHLVNDFHCNINLQDVEGWTPLHAASAVGSIRIAQFLLDNGAKASILSKNCEFPVDVAEEEGIEELLKKAMLGPSIGKMFKGIFR